MLKLKMPGFHYVPANWGIARLYFLREFRRLDPQLFIYHFLCHLVRLSCDMWQRLGRHFLLLHFPHLLSLTRCALR